VRCGSQGEDPALRSAHTADDMTCDGCGQAEPLGAEHAYLQAPGMVLRCCHCEQVLLVVTRANGTYLLSFRGVRWFELPAES